MRYYKLTFLNENHYGFQYKDGLNVDTVPFNPNGTCKPGGLYFFSEIQLVNWNEYIGNNICWIRLVEIPNDAKVFHEKGKSKADKLFLHPREEFKQEELDLYIDFNDINICLAVVKENGRVLRYIKNQTQDICLAAVNAYGDVLQFVKDQTEDICIAAVKNQSSALIYVKNQTEAICIAAVEQDAHALEYVKDQTDPICFAAVKKDGSTLRYIKNKTDEICLAAVKQNGYALQFVKNQNKEICFAAIRRTKNAITFVNDKHLYFFLNWYNKSAQILENKTLLFFGLALCGGLLSLYYNEKGLQSFQT